MALGALLATAMGCGGGAPSRPAAPADVEDDTTLGIGDVFDVRVYGESDLSSTYRVAQDGSIDFPLIGRLEVAGMVPTELADRLTQELRERQLLTDPQVSIYVQEYNSKRISVIGAVARPGSYPMTPGLTAVQAISLAGGFNALANRNAVVVTRRVEGELRRFRVEAADVTRGTEEDFPLRAGDMIYVPERAF